MSRDDLARGVHRSVAVLTSTLFTLGFVGVTVASEGHSAGMATTPFVDSLRSVAHLLGIGFSVLLVYYAIRARQLFKGGVFGEAAKFAILGSMLFAFAFLQMELAHAFDLDLLAPIGDPQLKMGVRMFLFTGTVFMFGWAYYLIADVLGGG